MTDALTVNGKAKAVTRAADTDLLIDYLREECGLLAVKRGCGSQACGACTVLLDGRAVRSCSVLVAQVLGRAVTTLEGLSGDGQLHKVQQALGDYHGLQCGFCTPGMIMALVSQLHETSDVSREMIRQAVQGNLCRCTGYQNIVEAAVAASVSVRTHSDER